MSTTVQKFWFLNVCNINFILFTPEKSELTALVVTIYFWVVSITVVLLNIFYPFFIFIWAWIVIICAIFRFNLAVSCFFNLLWKQHMAKNNVEKYFILPKYTIYLHLYITHVLSHINVYLLYSFSWFWSVQYDLAWKKWK